MQTGAIRELSRHPFPVLLRRDVSVSLSTDNRTISGTTLSDEYALASDVLNLSWAELARATVLAARAIFALQRELVHRIQSAWASRAPEPGRPEC
jgi:adenosine deaminase